MWKIKYCGSWNYKPQAESLSVDMNNAGLLTTFEEGDKGQFELFQHITVENSGYWVSYMKAGHGVFFVLRDVELKLSGKWNSWE